MHQPNKLIKRTPQPGDPSRPLPALPLSSLDDEELDIEEKAELGLRKYLEIVRKHVWIIVGLTAITTVATAVYMAKKPDVFGAAARVQIDLESNPAMGANGNGVIVGSAVNAPNYFGTQLEILRGPGLLRRVVKTLDLEHNRAFFSPQIGQRSTWQRLKGMVGLASPSAEQQIPVNDQEVLLTTSVAPATERENLAEIKRLSPYVGVIQSGLEVEQIGQTRLVEIRFVHRDPQVAAKVVNAIADTFVLSNLERMTETNSGAANFLKKRIADLQSQIRNGEERLINYAKDNQIISLDANQNTVVERLSGLNRQLMEAENERKLAEAAYRSAREPGAAAALTGGTAGTSGAENKLNELRAQLAQLRAEYTEKWPAIRTLKEEIEELEKQVADSKRNATDTLLKTLETKLLEAQRREQATRDAFDRQRNETIAQNSAAINYRIIQQEIQTNQELLTGLLQRFKENDVILAGTPNNIRVADYANTPESPLGPQRTRAVGLAFVFSLVFGVGLAILREVVNNTVRTAIDVERKIHLPAIAVVPKMKGSLEAGLSPASRFGLQRRNGRNGNGHRTGRPLLMYDDARSPLAEIYRKLRTTVLLSDETPKSLLVTSSLPAEGKTTTAVNTAEILAQSGASVLLIDADMRQPTLHEIFGFENHEGLSNLLTGQISLDGTHALIHHHQETGLNILTAGPVPLKPAELLSSQKFQSLLETIEPAFSHIIIDSPPVLAFTDSVLMASLVDGVILVVQGNRSTHEMVRHARNELLEVGANIFGVVLNGAEAPRHEGYYYYYRAYNNT